jgi:hypothetical protein
MAVICHASLWRYTGAMTTIEILAAIDAEITVLQQARAILAGVAPVKGTHGAAKVPRKRHKMSAEARAKIAAAQKKRWAAQKKAQKKTKT